METKQQELEKVNEKLKPLQEKLFGNDKFKVFTEEEINSNEYKQYNILVKEKQRLLFEIDEENRMHSYYYSQEFDYISSHFERFSTFD